MNPFFLDPKIERLPPEKMRILALHVESYPDGRRLRIRLEITPFQKRPELELELTDRQGLPCGSVSLIEPMSWSLELTMHIRNKQDTVISPLTLTAILLYPDIGEIDRRQITFDIPLSA
ncbi:MAG: hypothetical protein N2049_07050 [Anaerolineales bacterium]|nr:hypothetical protein [Anaerolineales bacterium]MCX7608958.1 hypothetical protein [Anaerolineales bacterium]